MLSEFGAIEILNEHAPVGEESTITSPLNMKVRGLQQLL